MIYITGDKHRDFRDVFTFCYQNETSIHDILIILGDVGINYYLDNRDKELKKRLYNLPITLFCIQGNHEERPENISTYKTKFFHGGIVFYEDDYPNLIFAKDGEIYDFNNLKTIVIGGAYSIDKEYRILNGYPWFKSEQPSEEAKNSIIKTLSNHENEIDVILSHTCPFKYMPYEVFRIGINEIEVDKSTEKFLDTIENNVSYQKWYCGHFHTDKQIDKMQFLMYDFMEFGKKEKILKKSE